MCKQPDCDNCGYDSGYSVIQGFEDKTQSKDFYWIDPRRPNMSHDMWFASIVFTDQYVRRPKGATVGAPEDMTNYTDGKSSNIFSFLRWLTAVISERQSANAQLSQLTNDVVATLDVFYDGKPYVFTVLPDKQEEVPLSPTPTPTPLPNDVSAFDDILG